MEKIKLNKFNLFNKILNESFSGKLITIKKKIFIKKEITKYKFLRKKRSLCLIECYNSYNSILSYLSVMAYGSVPLLVNENLNSIFFKNYIKKFRPEYIITKRNLTNKKYKLYKIVNNLFFYRSKYKNSVKLFKDLAILLPTSGSTGSLKMVRISYKNLYSNTIDICKFLKIKKQDIAITTMPFSYTYGMSIINSHIIKGSSIFVYSGSVIQKIFFDILERFKITTFGGVPFIFSLLLKVGLNRLKSKYLKYLTHAGGPIDKKLLLKIYNFCKKNNLKFISMYGSSEATSRMSYLPFLDMKRKMGSIGKGLQKSFKVKDKENNQILDPFTKGELIYEGDNVCMGYANNWKDLALGDKNHSVLRTGDEGYFDKDGFFYISGRKNRYFKLYGHRISLDEIEKNLNTSFINCYVKFINEKLAVFSDMDINIKELENFVFKRFNIQKKIVQFIKIKKIP
jgi:acyl-coenzyme A synthetase/AMP-(fatty) acid ligase